jgi:hypothetical protein
MSIRDSITVRIEEGRLWQLRPILDSDPVKRTMIISHEIRQLIDGPWPNNKGWARRCGRLRADLETFVKGERIGLCLTPYAAGTAYMGRLDKPTDEVWDIRSRDPDPGLRVFGRFPDRDLFVALIWSPRSIEIVHSQRPSLGDRNSIQWKTAIRETKAEWRKLFQPYEAFHGEVHDDYVSKSIPV